MSRLIALPALLLLLLVAPAGAGAATFSVTTAVELASALDTADSNDADDVIEIAAGATTLAGVAGYAYNAALTDEDNDITINGHGRTISGPGVAVLQMTNLSGTGDTTVNDVHLVMDATNTHGLDMQAHGTVRGVTVSGTGAVVSNGLRTHRITDVRDVTISSSTQQGVMVEGSTATFTDLDVSGSTSRFLLSYGTVNIDGATLHDPFDATVTGIEAGSNDSVAQVARARIAGVYRGVQASFGGHATVTDSLITLPPSPSVALLANDNSNPSANASIITAERLTVVGTGNTSQFIARADGGSGTEKDQMQVAVGNSVVTAVPNGAACYENNAQSVNSVTLERVNQEPEAADDSTCDGSPASGVTRTEVTALKPGFVNAAGGDYHLRADSPLVDRGPNAIPVLFEPARDLDGAERLNDGDGDCVGELDLGAFEAQVPTAAACLPPAPGPGTTPTPTAGGSTPNGATAPDRTAPAITRLKVAKAIRRSAKPPVTIRFRLGEAATVKLAFRKAKGKRFAPVKGAITLKLKAGDQRVRFAGRLSKTRKLPAGSYQVVITATDAAGNRSPAQRAGFRLSD